MTSKAKKIRVAIFALAAGIVFAFTIIVFAGVHFWRDRTHYHIEFSHTVYGLEQGADVYFNGVRCGSVDDISIDRDDPTKVRVEIEVDTGTPILTDTEAVLSYAGITGVKVIDLRGGKGTSPRLAANMGIKEGTSILDELADRGSHMLANADVMVERMASLASKADQLVDNLTQATDPTQIGSVVADARAAIASFSQATNSLRRFVDSNNAGFGSAIASIDAAAKHAADLLEDGQLRAAVADLRQASRSFKELARDVRQKPSRLFISDPAPDRKLP